MIASVVPDTIISRLASTARLRPAAAAIIEGDVRVSYAQLEADSIAIAHRVLAAGSTSKGNVAIFFADKIPAIAAVYGAIRSGHACVPMEVGDPAERLRIILEDCDPVALLTDAAHAALARSLAPASCAIIDIGDATTEPGTGSLPTVLPDELVYVSYTSGSTGRPKGVTQTHANLVFFMNSYVTAFGIGPGDRMTMLYALGVPAGFGDVLRIIGMGATMCVYDVRRKGIADLADWLDRQRITFLHAVPTVVRQMASRLGPKRVLPHLRVVHMGGEAVFAGDVALVRAHTLEHCVVMNQLASTEVGIMARNIMTHDEPIPSQGVIAAGRPIDGVRVEVLRADGSVAAVDEIGEMFASSAHTSPGYWRRPDLDAIAFSADPGRPGWRRYRSGDLGRVDAEGTLWFVGRSGGRVKVNGHSVDLMEVEGWACRVSGRRTRRRARAGARNRQRFVAPDRARRNGARQSARSRGAEAAARGPPAAVYAARVDIVRRDDAFDGRRQDRPRRHRGNADRSTGRWRFSRSAARRGRADGGAGDRRIAEAR